MMIPPPPDGHPKQIPLDPGSWVLVAAGVGYGVKKWWDARQNAAKKMSGETAHFLQDDNINHNNL